MLQDTAGDVDLTLSADDTGYGGVGKALVCDGAGRAQTVLELNGYPTYEPVSGVKFDFWMKSDGWFGTSQGLVNFDYLAGVFNVAEGDINFYCSTSGGEKSVRLNDVIVPGSWHHVIALFDETGYQELSVDGTVVSQETGATIKTVVKPGSLGAAKANNRYYHGLIDEFTLSIFP